MNSLQHDIFDIAFNNIEVDEGPCVHDLLLGADQVFNKYNDGGLVGIALIEWLITKLQDEAEEYRRAILED